MHHNYKNRLLAQEQESEPGEVTAAFRAGEDWAFRKLFARYRKTILRYTRERVSDPETAEDISQEVFLKAYRARASYEPTFPFSAWLRTIARNTLIDWFRRGAIEPSPNAEEVPCPEPTAEVRLLAASERQQLQGVLNELTVTQRKVLQLRLLDRLSCREIARMLGLSLSAVKCLVYRSKRKVLPSLQPA